MSVLQILEVTGGGGGLLVILLTLVEIAPVKLKPWSWLAKAVSRAMGIEAIEKKLDEHITMDDKRMADSHRTQILRFNNELLRDLPHTKEEFIEVMHEIDEYEKYCKDHPEYPNNRAVLAIEHIRAVYMERQKKRDFLQDSGSGEA